METWDADGFDPWATLRWEIARVVRYRQYEPTGTVYEAYLLTDFLRRRVSSRAIFRMAKSRWEIENEGFNQSADGPRTATASNISATMKETACWWSGS